MWGASHADALRDRVIIVTGGASGIGLHYSRHCAAAGAAVVLADLSGEAAEDRAAELVANGARALGIGVDIADEAAVARMATRVLHRFGRIDGLVNNASLMSTLPRRDWLEIPLEEWDRVMAVNLRGLFLCCRAVVPAMRARQQGSIVNIASTRAFDGTPNRLHYTTSKAGVLGFTRALAREVGDAGIRVNAVAPGLTLSDAQLASSSAAYLAELGKGRALPRPQTPDDLVGAVLFLLGDGSTYVTGQTLVVDGGKVMH